MIKHAMPDVIVLLPGIMGSVLKKKGRAVWGFSPGSIARSLFTLGDSIADGLRLEDDDLKREFLDDEVTAETLFPDLHLISGFWKIDGYRYVSDQIQARFDVRKGENFFEFPYDWRRDIRVAAHRLQRLSHDWLSRYRVRSPEAKLILVAHSMGGLVSRYFLEVLEGWNQTKALITVGTPYRGSLNALKTLSNGIWKGPLKLHEMTAFAQSCTAMYQLGPIYEAYDDGHGKLLRVGECTGIPGVDDAKARSALAFHREIITAVDSHLKDAKYQTDRYRVFPVVGTTQPTLQAARLVNGAVTISNEYRGEDMSGDGTVPRVSAIPH